MLCVQNLEAAYGASQVLFSVSLRINAGEVVTLLGRNGMGKTTTINAIMGIVKPAAGSIRLEDNEIAGAPSFRIAQRGLGLVPEGRQIFPNLTVSENLVATAANRRKDPTPWTPDRVMDMFPQLASRKSSMGNLLSGGEQQMLAIGRALMTNPRLLILDEATEGLAPMIREEIWTCLRKIRDDGLSILVVDKNVSDLVKLADRHYVLEKGHVVWDGDSEQLRSAEDVQHRYLGV
ncbi:MAG: ABC transporter ATP-binding protein [Hyphomicrobiaceae bacterium]